MTAKQTPERRLEQFIHIKIGIMPSTFFDGPPRTFHQVYTLQAFALPMVSRQRSLG